MLCSMMGARGPLSRIFKELAYSCWSKEGCYELEKID